MDVNCLAKCFQQTTHNKATVQLSISISLWYELLVKIGMRQDSSGAVMGKFAPQSWSGQGQIKQRSIPFPASCLLKQQVPPN